jgi:hypothetical protein
MNAILKATFKGAAPIFLGVEKTFQIASTKQVVLAI